MKVLIGLIIIILLLILNPNTQAISPAVCRVPIIGGVCCQHYATCTQFDWGVCAGGIPYIGGICVNGIPKIDMGPPIVNLNQPVNNLNISSQTITFNFTATDDLAPTFSCELILDGSVNQTNSSVINNTLTNFQVDGLSEGQHTWEINCTDSANYEGSSVERILSVDMTPPAAIFILPTLSNNSYTNNNYILVNISANEILSSCFLEWQEVNESITVFGDYCYKNKTGLSDGEYYFRVWANDTSDNWNVTGAREIIVDTIPPDIVIYSPANKTYNTTEKIIDINLNVTANELIDKWWYNLNDSNNVTFTPNTTLKLGSGYYKLTVYANDSAGNVNYSIVQFSVIRPLALFTTHSLHLILGEQELVEIIVTNSQTISDKIELKLTIYNYALFEENDSRSVEFVLNPGGEKILPVRIFTSDIGTSNLILEAKGRYSGLEAYDVLKITVSLPAEFSELNNFAIVLLIIIAGVIVFRFKVY